MTRVLRKCLPLILILLLSASCGRRSSNKNQQSPTSYRNFPMPSVPALYNAPEARAEYLSANMWGQFMSLSDSRTDTLYMLGVPREQVEKCVGMWISFLNMIPLNQAQKDIDKLFTSLETHMKAHPEDSLFYLRYTEMICSYMYDPNSPLRDEDLFLPFVKRLASSVYTREDMRPGYEYQALMCSRNQRGSLAPDFKYTTASGRRGSLYGIKADYTLIMFSNPGCTSCREIISGLCSRPYISTGMTGKQVKVLNLYIDEEVNKWREYLPEYPTNWINAYEHKGVIRGEQIYDVRAIPSLYLLDADKHILMKDAPLERVLGYLDTQLGLMTNTQ